ncbi:MAG: TRAP transporter substrate-binding protein DctP, partial [Xanthobacteraceae bacterium]
MSAFTKTIPIICAAIAALALATIEPAAAQVVQLKASLFTPSGNPIVRATEKWADDLKEKSGGRLNISVFPGGQMGPPPRQFDLVRTGVADIAVILNGSTPGRFPLTELSHLPGIVKGNYSGSLGLSEIAQDVLGPDYPGVKILNIMVTKTMIISRNEIDNVSALKGKRVRAAGSVQSDVLEALGAVPTVVQPGDMNDALNKGMIEGVSTAYSAVDSYKLDDVAKFIAEGNMGIVTFAALMNQAAYDALPLDMKHLIDESSGLAGAKLFGKMLADDERGLRDNIVKHGVKITQLTDDGTLQAASDQILAQALKKAEAR